MSNDSQSQVLYLRRYNRFNPCWWSNCTSIIQPPFKYVKLVDRENQWDWIERRGKTDQIIASYGWEEMMARIDDKGYEIVEPDNDPIVQEPRIFTCQLPWKPQMKIQDVAIEFANATHQMVFAFDLPWDEDNAGWKGYVVMKDPQQLMEAIRNAPRRFWNFYQLIPLFRRVGLYVDVEYDKLPNGHLDEHRVVHAVCHYLCQKWPQLAPDLLIILTASDHAKASFHFTTAAVLFENNTVDLKNQMEQLREMIQSDFEAGNDIAQDLIRADNEHVIDYGVYTTNRLWRLGGQCKKKYPDRPLRLYSAPASIDQDIFVASMVYVGEETSREVVVQNKRGRPHNKTNRNSTAKSKRTATSNVPEIWNWAVDQVVQMVNSKNPECTLNKKNYDPEQHCIYLSFANAHNCWQQQKEHERNNIYVFIDLKLRQMHFRCYNEICKKMKPAIMPLDPRENMEGVECSIMDDDVQGYDAADTNVDGSMYGESQEQESSNNRDDESDSEFSDHPVSWIEEDCNAASDSISDRDATDVHDAYAESLAYLEERLRGSSGEKLINAPVEFIKQNYGFTEGWKIEHCNYDEIKNELEFHVCNSSEERPPCPIISKLHGCERMKVGKAGKHVINMAHDLIPHETEGYVIQCHVHCTCKYKNQMARHEWLPIPVNCYPTADLQEINLSAVKAEAIRHLLPEQYYPDLEEGRIEVIPLNNRYMPDVENQCGADKYIKSPTGSGKTRFIHDHLKPLSLLQRCLKLFHFSVRCEGRPVHTIDEDGLKQFLVKDFEALNTAFGMESKKTPRNVQEAEKWFRNTVLRRILKVTVRRNGTIRSNSLQNIPLVLRPAIDREPLPEKTILFISPLISIAHMIAKLYGAVNYFTFFQNKGTPAAFMEFNSVVCSLESIIKCLRGKYTCLVLDEGSTIFSRASDETMDEKGLRTDRMGKFLGFIRDTDELIMADQNLSISDVKQGLDRRPPHANKPPVKIIYNVFAGTRPKVCLTKDTPKNIGFFKTVKLFATHNCNASPEDVIPVAISVNYRALGKDVVKQLVEWDKTIARRKDILFISQHNKHRKKQQAAIKNPTKEWCKYRYVIYTPTVQAGLDHNPEIPYFGVLIGQLGNGKYGIAEYFIQQIGRVRATTMNTILLFASDGTRGTSKLTTNEEEIEQRTKENAKDEFSHYSQSCMDELKRMERLFQGIPIISELYDTGERDLYVHNFATKRETINNPHDRLASLLVHAGHHIQRVWQDHIFDVCKALFQEYSIEICVTKSMIDMLLLLPKQSEADIILGTHVTEEEKEELMQNNKNWNLSEKQIRNRRRLEVEDRLFQTELRSRYDVQFALSPEADKQYQLFELLITPEMPFEQSGTDLRRYRYEIQRYNPILSQIFVLGMLTCAGYPGNDLSKQVICESQLQQCDSVQQLNGYLHRNYKQIEKLTLLQSLMIDRTKELTPKAIIPVLKSLLKCCGLKLSRMPESRTAKENPGYQVDTISWNCMLGIYKRKNNLDTVEFETPQFSFTRYQDLFPLGVVSPYPHIYEGSPGDSMSTAWQYDQQPIGFEIWSTKAKLVVVIAHRNCYVFTDHIEHLPNIASVIDFCFDYCKCSPEEEIQYRYVGYHPPDEQELYRKSQGIHARILRHQRSDVARIQKPKDEHIMVVDKSWFSLEDNIDSLLGCRNPETGCVVLWKASLWRTHFSFSKCACGKRCAKKCKRPIETLVCFDIEKQ